MPETWPHCVEVTGEINEDVDVVERIVQTPLSTLRVSVLVGISGPQTHQRNV